MVPASAKDGHKIFSCNPSLEVDSEDVEVALVGNQKKSIVNDSSLGKLIGQEKIRLEANTYHNVHLLGFLCEEEGMSRDCCALLSKLITADLHMYC